MPSGDYSRYVRNVKTAKLIMRSRKKSRAFKNDVAVVVTFVNDS